MTPKKKVEDGRESGQEKDIKRIPRTSSIPEIHGVRSSPRSHFAPVINIQMVEFGEVVNMCVLYAWTTVIDAEKERSDACSAMLWNKGGQ